MAETNNEACIPKKKPVRIGITIEIIGMIVACVLVFAVISTYISYRIFSGIIKMQMETRIENTCHIARDSVDGDLLDEYLESGGKSATSKIARRYMQRVCDDTKFNYIYIIRPDIENGKVLNLLSVVGSMYPELKTYETGESSDITADDYYEAYKDVMAGNKDIAFVYRLDMPYELRYRHHITGLAPIRDSNDNVVGIMCAEATFAWYKEALRFYINNVLKWLAFILIGSTVVCGLLIRLRVVVPFIKITKETDRFAKSNTIRENSIFDEVKRKNELGQLAESVDLMEHQTVQYIDSITQMTADKERLNAELSIASKIQASAIPHVFPAFPDRNEFSLYAYMKPAKEVGGDFYDFFFIDEDHLALVMADVSGKGVPAALFMMESKITIENYASVSMDPARILELVNDKINENNEEDMFVTVWLAIIEISTGIMKTANAGHEDPVIKRYGSDYVLTKEKHGLVIGAMEGVKYKTQEYKLNKGDTVFIYTDGIPEATDNDNNMYGLDRMVNTLIKCQDEDELSCIEANLRIDIADFVNGAPQFDDLTMLVFRYCGNE